MLRTRAAAPRNARLAVRSANTHLYRGAKLSASIDASELGASPRGLRLEFRDGVVVDAELLQNDEGDLAVDVPAYRTGAGTNIPAKAWHASAVEHPDGAALLIGHAL
ncbi:hypothetical protein [Microbacterium sp. SA39]|uniref:hypothetical protein n=1 Tax=Microbacterium sp. SA39 TaxID=1263625 RepID=UPI0005FA23F2|nr:hypothetical protein [Microbacterium sp. SA39]KJQ55991.1 hypothetical protein RS85_00117 [Microbacterium sp. SA39]